MKLLGRGRQRFPPARGFFGADPTCSSDEGLRGRLVFGYLSWGFNAMNGFFLVVSDDVVSAVV